MACRCRWGSTSTCEVRLTVTVPSLPVIVFTSCVPLGNSVRTPGASHLVGPRSSAATNVVGMSSRDAGSNTGAGTRVDCEGLR